MDLSDSNCGTTALERWSDSPWMYYQTSPIPRYNWVEYLKCSRDYFSADVITTVDIGLDFQAINAYVPAASDALA